MALARIPSHPPTRAATNTALLDMPMFTITGPRPVHGNGNDAGDEHPLEPPRRLDVTDSAVARVGVDDGNSPGGLGAGGDVVVASPSRLETDKWWAAFAVAVLAIAAGTLVGVLALPDPDAGGGYRVGGDLSAFAALFVLALAVERLLEPLARWSGTAEAKDQRDQAEANATGGDPKKEQVQALADAQARYDIVRQQAAIGHWGLAVGISAAVVGGLDVLLLTAISAADSAQPNQVVDLLVTAFVVGAGTKPLHDLVTKLEKKKEQAQDPASVGGSA